MELTEISGPFQDVGGLHLASVLPRILSKVLFRALHLDLVGRHLAADGVPGTMLPSRQRRSVSLSDSGP